MLKLKLQYFGHLMRRVDSLEKTLMLGRIGGSRRGDDRGWDGWMASPTRCTWVWVNSGCWWCTGRPGVLRFMGSQRIRHDWATELNWILKKRTSALQCKPVWYFIQNSSLGFHGNDEKQKHSIVMEICKMNCHIISGWNIVKFSPKVYIYILYKEKECDLVINLVLFKEFEATKI